MTWHVLLVDDDPVFRDDVTFHLAGSFRWSTATGSEDAFKALRGDPPDVVLLDVDLGEGPDGFDILTRMRAEGDATPVVFVTRSDDAASGFRARAAGADDYIAKGSRMSVLADRIEQAVELATLRRQNRVLRDEVDATRGEFVAESPAMQRVVRTCHRVASDNCRVLLTGESGTGKTRVAQEIHDHSARAGQPFLKVCVTELSESLLESELFGHEKGAFTGATARRDGKFHAAHRGTILLDEVGELSPHLQAKLLGVLDGDVVTVTRVGGTEPATLDVRVIAATHRDLPSMVSRGTFREDLYHRLTVFPIEVPPLRDRPEDLSGLLASALAREARRRKRSPWRLGSGVVERLREYPWPGNIRELENLVRRTVVLADGDEIDLASIDGALGVAVPPASDAALESYMGLGRDAFMAHCERAYTRRVLEACDGNRSEAARRLGMTREGLRKALRRLAKDPRSGRP